MESKKDIRRRILALRERLSDEEQDEKSQCIFNQVINHSFFLETDTIYCYVDYKQEVKTRSIIQYAWKLGKKVAVPKIIDDEMFFCFIESFEELTDGYRGIPEPAVENYADASMPLVIMPGVAFDRSKNRIGYGKGFYDRFLNAHSYSHTIALCYEMQLIGNLPVDSFDIKPEILITEKCIYDK